MSNSPDATPSLSQYREYILQEGATEGERLSLQHTIFKPNFLDIFNQVLYEVWSGGASENTVWGANTDSGFRLWGRFIPS